MTTSAKRPTSKAARVLKGRDFPSRKGRPHINGTHIKIAKSLKKRIKVRSAKPLPRLWPRARVYPQVLSDVPHLFAEAYGAKGGNPPRRRESELVGGPC